jgi:hypothetical protein
MKTYAVVIIVVVVVAAVVFGSLFMFGMFLLAIDPSLANSPVATSEPYSFATSIPPLPDYTATPSPVSVKHIAITYSISTKQSITWSGSSGYSYDVQADSGKMFVEVKMTITNNGYDSFNTNPYYFNLVANNVKYDHDANTYLVDDWDTVDILDGGTSQGTLVFQVPTSESSLSLGYERAFTTYNVVWTQT